MLIMALNHDFVGSGNSDLAMQRFVVVSFQMVPVSMTLSDL